MILKTNHYLLWTKVLVREGSRLIAGHSSDGQIHHGLNVWMRLFDPHTSPYKSQRCATCNFSCADFGKDWWQSLRFVKWWWMVNRSLVLEIETRLYQRNQRAKYPIRHIAV